jgi:hypothetical protein
MEEIFRALDKFKKYEIGVTEFKKVVSALKLDIKNT